MSQIILPTHSTVLRMWEVAMEGARLVYPDDPPEGAVFVAPANGLIDADLIAPIAQMDSDMLDAYVTRLVESAKEQRILADPCPWLAVAAPCYIRKGDVTREHFDGAVRQAFIDGEEGTHAAVAVFIVTYGLPLSVVPMVTMRLYVQPTLEPTGSKPKVMSEGLTVGVLTKAIQFANQP